MEIRQGSGANSDIDTLLRLCRRRHQFSQISWSFFPVRDYVASPNFIWDVERRRLRPLAYHTTKLNTN